MAQLVFQLQKTRFVDQITLVEQNHVAVDDLGSAHLSLEQFRTKIFCIHKGDDGIQSGGVPQVAAQKGHRDRKWICQAGRFHHQIVDRLRSIKNSVDGLQQFTVDGAADAAIAELHHVVAGGHHQVVIDANFAEFIHENGGFETLLIGEDVVQQGGLTGPQEAGQDGHRHPGGCGAGGRDGRGSAHGFTGNRSQTIGGRSMGTRGSAGRQPTLTALAGLAQSKEFQGVKERQKSVQLTAGKLQRMDGTVGQLLGGAAVHACEVVVIPFRGRKQGLTAGQMTASHQAPLLQLP